MRPATPTDSTIHQAMTHRRPRIAVCIPHWQVLELITVCLRSIRRHSSRYDLDVYVVDNGSQDASLDYLRYLAREPAEHAILLIASYRDDEITRRHQLFQLIPVLVREAGAERVVLHRFDETSLRGLIESRYQLSEPDLERHQSRSVTVFA